MNAHRTNESQTEQIEDLTPPTAALNPEQVKGGFNPQPDPPKIGLPVQQLPVLTPGFGR